jgi:Na+/H+ antiporter NhaC
MSDKFKVNSMIVMPVAVIVFIIYIVQGLNVDSTIGYQQVEWIKVIPYLVVLITAILGMNVIVVLVIGIILSGIAGLITSSFDIFTWLGAMKDGILSMGELIIITLLAGGMLEIIRYNGGIDFITRKLTQHISGKRGAELSIASLVSIANLCTANNTIAIITTGSMAKGITEKYHLDKRKTASILDTYSCFIQGIIPYGAQVLMAAGLSKLSPITIVGYLYYPFAIGIAATLSILLRYPRRYS